MKSADKFLIAIVAGVILLVMVAFIVVLNQPQPGYQEDHTPEGVIYNYLLALQQEDFARAYGYLSPSLAGYPPTLTQFIGDISANPWQFGLEGDQKAFMVNQAALFDHEAVVTVELTQFRSGGLFDNGTYTETSRFTLTRSGEAWRIAGGDYSFWWPCWETPENCP